MKEYPLFIPPDNLIDVPREMWNKCEAEQYFSWQISSIESRVGVLLNYLDVVDRLEYERVNRARGKKARTKGMA